MEKASSSRVALVTGSTRGIGESIARALAREPVHVVVSGRDEARGRDLARELGAASFRTLDVTRQDDIAGMAAWLKSERGGLDILVNNAGVALEGFDESVARRTLDANFVGTMALTDRLLPALRTGARVVMVSSGVGSLSSLSNDLRARFTDPALDREGLRALTDRFVADVASRTHARNGWPTSAYGVSKIAMNAYVRILARELADDPRKILVNAACPGWVRTKMGGRSAPRSPEVGAETPTWLALLPEGGPNGGFFRDRRPIPW
jgi:carbonyl reductase 1